LTLNIAPTKMLDVSQMGMMPWTVAVVDLRRVSLPDWQDVRPFFQPPFCQQAVGARRSNPLRAPLIRAIWTQLMRTSIWHRIAPYRERELAIAFVRVRKMCLRARAWPNTRVAVVRIN